MGKPEKAFVFCRKAAPVRTLRRHAPYEISRRKVRPQIDTDQLSAVGAGGIQSSP